MLARLLLALLLAAFAVPNAAPAACHDAPVARHIMPMPDHAPDQRALPAHACVGCIPPSDWVSPRLDGPASVRAAAPSAAQPDRLAGTSPPPDLPPPRRG